MAYKNKPLSKTFPYAVEFSRIEEDGSQTTHVIRFDFVRKKRSDIDSLFSEQPGNVPAGDVAPVDLKRHYEEMLDKDVAFVLRFTAGWHDVEIDDSAEFNAAGVRVLLDENPGLAHAMFLAYTEGNSGGIRKN